MKWGYVSYYFLHSYINYHILCNKKATKKPKKKKRLAELRQHYSHTPEISYYIFTVSYIGKVDLSGTTNDY